MWVEEPQGKICSCGSPMVGLTSFNLRICSGCKSEQSWNLDEGQKSLIGSNRQDRKPPKASTLDEINSAI